MQALCFFILSKLPWNFFELQSVMNFLHPLFQQVDTIISLIFCADKTKYQYSPNYRNKENNPIKGTNVQQAGFRVGYISTIWNLQIESHTLHSHWKVHPYRVHVYWPVKK